MKKKIKLGAMIVVVSFMIVNNNQIAKSPKVKIKTLEPTKTSEPQIIINPTIQPTQTITPKPKETKIASRSINTLSDRGYKSLGLFKITKYCACSICCGESACGITFTGTRVKNNYTVAVDPRVIPLGSILAIDGIRYRAEDTGSAVKGRIIDIYTSSHVEAERFGVAYKNVYIKSNEVK